MRLGSVIALVTLFTFTGAELAFAASSRVSDGSCGEDSGHHHGGGCGFLGLGCVADAIGTGLGDAAHVVGEGFHDVASVASTFNAGAFFAGLGKGLVMGAIGAAIFAGIVAFAPAWVVAGVVVLGAAALTYSAVKIGMNWGSLSSGQQWGVVGQMLGGTIGGLGAGQLISRGLASGVAVGLDGVSGGESGGLGALSGIPKPPLAPFQPEPQQKH